jgi:flagellar biosynthesis/type III secretory pathway chaperone
MIALRKPSPAINHAPVEMPAALIGPETLQTELDFLKQFHDLLLSEIALLESPPFPDTADNLSAIAGRRAILAAQLQAAARARTDNFRRSGLAADAAALRTFFSSNDCSLALRRAWHTLQRAYRQIAARHLANAQFMQHQTRYLQNRRNGLLQSAGSTAVYSSSGTQFAESGRYRAHPLLASA